MKKLMKIWVWWLVYSILSWVTGVSALVLFWIWAIHSAITHQLVTGWLFAWVSCFVATLLVTALSEKFSQPLREKWRIVIDTGHAKIAENS